MKNDKAPWFEYKDGVLYFDSLDRIKFEDPYYSLCLEPKTPVHGIEVLPERKQAAAQVGLYQQFQPVEFTVVELHKSTPVDVLATTEIKLVEKEPQMSEDNKEALQVLQTWVDFFRGTYNADDLISRNFNLPGQHPVAEVLQTYVKDIPDNYDTFYIPSSWC